MSRTILKVEQVSKQYRLGKIGTGTLSHDLNRWWHTVRGKENPYLKIGEANDRSTKGDSQYVWALQDINFEVKQGEVLGIIGKNGAGKSTLLKILSRVTSPTTGRIQFGGRVASLLEVGTGFHGEMTGRENIYLNGAILGMTKKEIASKIDEIIEFSGCERYIDTPVKRYSSGMTVRLAFAVAAHLEPEILVVDEVLAVGDAEFQKKAIGKMQDISKGEGRTVLFVSHNMAAVKSLCTRGLVLEHGRVVFDGGIDKSVDFYSSIVTDKLTSTSNHINITNEITIESIDFSVDEQDFKSGETIFLGKNLKITIKFKIQHNISDLSIAMDVLNSNLELMSHVTNEDDGFYIKNYIKNDEMTFSVVLNQILFTPGFYSINLWIGKGHIESLYMVQNMINFHVEQGDLTQRTKLLPKHSKVYLKSKWEKL